MARKHARLLLSIWDDDDFTALAPTEQTIYFGILSSRDLSWCGVAPLLPQRFTRNAHGLTERKVTAALDRLSKDRFVVIDRTTAELAVRTFVRHDEIMRQPNVVKAMATALDRVHSDRLRDVILEEVARDFIENPEYPGWKTLANCFPKVMAMVHEKSSGNPSANPSTKGR
jgi:hypothetical protein